MKILPCIILLTSFLSATAQAQQIRVACVGDSITAGAGASDLTKNYPAQLQSLLGSGYYVYNFGRGSQTLLDVEPDISYRRRPEFQSSLDFNADIVLIMLGTNDSKTDSPTGERLRYDFTNAYDTLIASYTNRPAPPRIILATIAWVETTGWTITPEIVENTTRPMIRDFAMRRGYEVVDIYSVMRGHSNWYNDTIHPNDTGYAQIAQAFRAQITWNLQPGYTQVRGNALAIADGSSAAVVQDGTAMGATNSMAGYLEQTFQVHNLGSLPVTLTHSPTVVITGANAGDFSVVSQPATTIGPSNYVSFTVRFDPGAEGTRTATISLPNSDSLHAAYNFAVSGIGTPPPLDMSAYTHRMKISFPGYNRVIRVSDFPALVQFGSHIPGFNYSQFQSTAGHDLRFADATETWLLPHEVEQWNVGGTSYVWVKVPAIVTSSDFIWAYWGNSAVAGQMPASQTNGSTWDTNFVAVWHLNETSGGNADSTTNHLDCTWTGTQMRTNGLAGGSQYFNYSSFARAAYNSRLNPANGRFTLETWVQSAPTENHNQYQRIVDHDWSAGYCITLSGAAPWVFRYDATSGHDGSISPVVDGDWHYAAMMYDGNLLYGYHNTANDLTSLQSLNLNSTAPLTIGADSGGSQKWHGRIDEVRISKSNRSTAWLWATRMTMASNAVFTSCGAVQSSTPSTTPSIHNASGASTVQTNTATLNGNLASTGGAPTRVWVYWGTSDAGTNKALWGNSVSLGQRSPGALSTDLIGLSAGQSYYYRFCASNSYAEVWAATTSFTTLAPLPVVTNAGWTAYNDLFIQSGETRTNITAYNGLPSGTGGGTLLNFASGTALTARVDMSMTGGGTPGQLGLDQTLTAGSDVLTVFDGKAVPEGYFYWANGVAMNMTLSNLNPAAQYKVVLFGNRGAYTDRVMRVTLGDVAAFVNVSSAGAAKTTSALTEDTTQLPALNSAGAVFAYSQIQPGPDGDIVLSVQADGNYTAYLNAIMVQELASGGDTDGDGMDDAWESQYFGSGSAANGGMLEDWDHDGSSNYDEYRAGTDPTSASSKLELTGCQMPTDLSGKTVLSWPGVPGKTYSLMNTTAPATAWTTLQSGITGVYPITVATVNVDTARSFWRVKVD